MNEPQPVAEAAASAGSTGFVVHRNGNDVEIQIDAPSRAAGITVACLVSALILIPNCFLLGVLAWMWMSARQDFDLRGATFAMGLTAICLWQTIAALRRIGSAHRRGSRTIFSVGSGVFWCAAAPEPASRYVWPVVDIWRLQATAARFSRTVLLQIRSRRRPLVRLRIPCKQPVAAETLAYILRHALNSAASAASQPALPDSASNAPSDGKSPPPAEFAIQYSSSASVDWVAVGVYPRFADWQDARADLSVIDVLSRLDSGLPDRESRYTLSVPQSQARIARDWLDRPQEWRDHSACPRCGATGEVLTFFRRIVRCVQHPTQPFALGKGWRFCEECQKSYYVRD